MSRKILFVVVKEPNSVSVAFAVMTLHKIGRTYEAKATHDQLRELYQDEQFVEDIEVQNLLVEAEKLIISEKQQTSYISSRERTFEMLTSCQASLSN
jgi:hypothetical protein